MTLLKVETGSQPRVKDVVVCGLWPDQPIERFEQVQTMSWVTQEIEPFLAMSYSYTKSNRS